MQDFQNLVQMFCRRAALAPEKPALWFKSAGSFHSICWSEFHAEVKRYSAALYALGVKRGDRVGILSENRPEWAFADLGILSLGAASVPIYPTSSSKEISYILTHAEVEVLFVSTSEQLEKLRGEFKAGKLKKVIIFDPEGPATSQTLPLNQFCQMGRLARLNNADLFDRSIREVGREDLATVIYTSGTTGPPKGVMLTHGNFLSNCESATTILPMGEGDRALSFLPLSHVFERMAGYYFMIFNGVSIAYAESMQTVPEDLLKVKPTVAAAVPRLYEKMYARILETVEKSSPVKQRLFHWALQAADRAKRLKQEKKKFSRRLKLQLRLASLLVFGKLKKKLGGRIRFFISGGAPLAKELAEFFYAAGVLILEGYGLTETSPVIAVNRPDRFKFGTVGPPLPGVEVKIAEDGEILSKGPHLMKGYFQSEEATRQVIQNGWFYTGDLGEIDAEGFLRITGRKKDIIVTAGGKNIAPQNIENEILGDPLFSQVVLVGDRRPYLVALIAPFKDKLLELAEERGIQGKGWEALLRDGGVERIIEERLSARTKDLAPYEQIKYFYLLPKELSQEAGEITPTLKVKRKVVMERYASIIEELYRRGETYLKGRR